MQLAKIKRSLIVWNSRRTKKCPTTDAYAGWIVAKHTSNFTTEKTDKLRYEYRIGMKRQRNKALLSKDSKIHVKEEDPYEKANAYLTDWLHPTVSLRV